MITQCHKLNILNIIQNVNIYENIYVELNNRILSMYSYKIPYRRADNKDNLTPLFYTKLC